MTTKIEQMQARRSARIAEIKRVNACEIVRECASELCSAVSDMRWASRFTQPELADAIANVRGLLVVLDSVAVDLPESEPDAIECAPQAECLPPVVAAE